MQIKNRNLFRITRFLITKLPFVLRLLAKLRKPQQRLLIIKTDAIGDYILFRNFIEIIKTDDLFKNYKIDLLGNPVWRDATQKYDAQYVNEFIFADGETFYDKPMNVLKLAIHLFLNNYAIVLHPTSSRTFINDGFAAFTAAKKIVGFESNTERIRRDYKIKADKFYTKLLRPPSTVYAEFDKSKYFFETILCKTISIKNAEIPIENTDKNGVVLFPGSGVVKRNWEPDKFLGLAQLIIQNTAMPIILAGGNAEAGLCGYLMENLPANRVKNLTGKTTLTQLIDLIANAALLISNETCAIQIAAATKTKSVCVLGGGHFNRFLPYSAGVLNEPLCVYEKMDCYNCDWACKFITNANEPHPCISAISLDNVWEETLNLLN
jgi:ADP-heptose:LPS heptosyltransferase